MKTLLFIASLFLLSPQSKKEKKAPRIQTIEFTVDGVCGACQKRIEKAALIPGVRMAEWDKDNNSLKVIYTTKRVDQNTIEKAIADQGHRTENVEANPEAYKNLPDCCAYETVEKH